MAKKPRRDTASHLLGWPSPKNKTEQNDRNDERRWRPWNPRALRAAAAGPQKATCRLSVRPHARANVQESRKHSPTVAAVLLTIPARWQQPKCLSRDRGTVHPHRGILLSLKKEGRPDTRHDIDGS